MSRRTIGSLLFVCLIAFGRMLPAQQTKTIIVKVFEGKSGHPVIPTGFQVRINHEVRLHGDWVKQNDDGTAELTLPVEAHEIALHIAYDNSMDTYVSCDSPKNSFGDVWYLVPQIMSEGFVAANACGRRKINEKYKTTALPGELILFVRPKNWKEEFKD